MSVKRYKLGHCVCGSQLEEHPGGGLVLHVDYSSEHAARLVAEGHNRGLQERCDELEAECARLRREIEDMDERAQGDAWDRDTRS